MEYSFLLMQKKCLTLSKGWMPKVRNRFFVPPAFIFTDAPAVAPLITPRASPTDTPRLRLNYQPTPKTITDRKLVSIWKMNMKL